MSKPQGVVTAGTASTKPVYGRGGTARAQAHPALRWPESVGRRLSGTWEPWLRCKRRSSSGRTTRARVRMRSRGAEQPVVAMKSPKREGAKGLCYGAEVNGQPVMGGADE